MEKLTNKEILALLKNLCCSRCKNDFSIEDFEIVEQYGNILICNLECKKCSKEFGQVIININRNSKEHLPLEIIDGPPPITVDDVINAHKYIKNNL